MVQEERPAPAGHGRHKDHGERGGPSTRSGYGDPRKKVGAALVIAALAAVPLLTLLGQRLLAVLWLATGMLVLAAFRLRRPEERWLAARGSVFDVVFAAVLAGAVFALAQYVNLPRVR